MTGVNELNLDVEVRSPMKNAVRKLKRVGKIPAVVYGLKKKNLYLSVRTNTAVKYSSSQFDNKIFTLQSKDKDIQGLKVLKKDAVFHKVSRQPIHIDFFALDMSKKIRVAVEVKFFGQSSGGERIRGRLQCLEEKCGGGVSPSRIPSSFEIDISALALNESCHVSDIKIPSHIKLVTRPEEALCSVSEVQEEIVETAPAVDPAGSAAESETSSTDEKTPSEKSDKKSADKE